MRVASLFGPRLLRVAYSFSWRKLCGFFSSRHQSLSGSWRHYMVCHSVDGVAGHVMVLVATGSNQALKPTLPGAIPSFLMTINTLPPGCARSPQRLSFVSLDEKAKLYSAFAV